MAIRSMGLLYVPEITLGLRKGVHRETSAIARRRHGLPAANILGRPPLICAADHIAEAVAAQVRLRLLPRQPDHPAL